MRKNRFASALALVVLLAAPRVGAAQTIVSAPDVWRDFAQRIDPGTTLKLRLTSGQRFKATLLQVSDVALILQPKTRIPVPPQQVAFADIESMEIDTTKGVGVGKAIAVGVASAAGAFLGLMVLAFAVWGD